MTMHAPGVVCIAHGLRGHWFAKDNGKLVVIVEPRPFSRRYGPMWLTRVYDDLEWLHVFRLTEGNCLDKFVAAPQRNLIPLGPEDSFLTPEPKEVEMVLTEPAEPMNTLRRTFICRKCNTMFTFYKGMKAFPGGTGLCKQHNPNYVQPQR